MSSDMRVHGAVRTIFLVAMIDGWTLRDNVEDIVRGDVIGAMKATGMQYGDLMLMVDAAYAHAENLSLPVGWVVMASLAVQRGETTTDVVLVALRQARPKTAKPLDPCDSEIHSDAKPIPPREW